MSTLREAAQMALEALEKQDAISGYPNYKKQRKALREALAQPEPEPVAWMVYTLDGKSVCVTDNPADFTEQHKALPLYTAPPSAAKPHKRKPLTDAEIDVACGPCDDSDIARAFRKEFIKRFRIVYERLPAQPQRKPLTPQEADAIWFTNTDMESVVRAVERAHGIGGEK